MQRLIRLNDCGGLNVAEGAARSDAGRHLTHFVLAAAVILVALVPMRLAMQPATGRAVDSGTPWAAHIRAMDDALARRDVGAAERAWGSSYRAAVAGRSWDGRLAAGDAALRIGEATGLRSPAEARARTSYMAALLQARERASIDGVARAAEAFAALGDREVANRGLTIAERLAAGGRDPQAGARVRQLRERLTARMAEGERVP